MSAVVYFSSASRNTERFVEHCDFPSCGVNVFRIPLQPNAAPLNVREPYIIIVPTYGGGDARKAVPPQVKRFLNDPANREWIRGVIASGNTNFGRRTRPPAPSSPANAMCRSCTASNSWAPGKTSMPCARASAASSPIPPPTERPQ